MPDILVLYDGTCGVCNRWVDFVLKRDANRLFSFAPLEGETSSNLSSTILSVIKDVDSIIVIEDDKVYKYSSAILYVFSKLSFPYRILAILMKLVPLVIRDKAYQFIASIRHKILPIKVNCRVPTEEEKLYLLP